MRHESTVLMASDQQRRQYASRSREDEFSVKKILFVEFRRRSNTDTPRRVPDTQRRVSMPDTIESTSQASQSFMQYLNEAAALVHAEFPGALLFSGAYEPNIVNFPFHYTFGTSQTRIKVTFNCAFGGCKPLNPIRIPPVTGLNPIVLPLEYSMEQAYQAALAAGYNPNTSTAPVYLQSPNDRSGLGPRYWFLDGNSQTWIEVDVNPPHTVRLTQEQPIETPT